MRFKRNSANIIKQVVISDYPDASIRYMGWSHIERRVKERLYKQATQQQIQAFLAELAELVRLELQGVSCITNKFVLKMGTFGVVSTLEDNVLTLQTVLSPGNWAHRDYWYASAALGQEAADNLSSKLWGLHLQWKQRLLQ